MINKLILLPVAAFFLLFLPFRNEKFSAEKSPKLSEIAVLEDDDKVLTLLQNNCFSCHEPVLGEERAAPPMFKIREHYKDEKIGEAEFTAKIIDFVNQPSEEKSLMPGARKKFGLMPKMSFKEDDLKQIAVYLYQTDMSTEVWAERWKKFLKEKKNSSENINFEDLGRNIANGTKAVLGKNLLEKIQKNGAEEALQFCNIKALPLADSMSRVFDAKVSRVSDKARNPKNKADKNELKIIEDMKKSLEKGEKPRPVLKERKGKVTAYYAIETNLMCLQCHGDLQKNIKPEVAGKISKLYPKDKAIGYGESQIRGLFKVEMKKKK
jgi:nitrate reductase cytochrome c-type subunit